ncbi:MAG: response regulator [Desulfobulbus sp.]|jgi:PAS domain S-box-containing protein|uniref:hybrid sensor histidine kinase/response regulator n=1 Tax=Desulfobulbus sp. TaxID=895 RepID=UPI00283BF8A2|nr:response regulator [Desulfobulbus sp.]MDR2550809.1 response regulator [Desulfobulbus sp.]
MPLSLLVVDDEVHLCNSLAILLKAEGYRVNIAHSGQDALRQLQRGTYAAALVDMDLPDMSGNHIAALIATDHPDTAIIILTGNATIDNAVESLRLGVYDFLRKPCPPDSLIRTIARSIQHKQLQRDLRNSEKRFRQLAQATWEGIIIYDRGELLLANNQLCKMFGYQESELLGRQIFDLLLDRNTIRLMNAPAESDPIGPFEARGIRKDGATFPVEFRVKHIDYQGRQVQVAAIRDVTDSEIAMQQKIALMEKLADAKRMESLGLMASSVAHDLNNIMAGIITYPELLLMDLGDTFQYREELLMIREAGKRAAAVVNDLLTVARGATCKKEAHNANDIIADYLKSVELKELYQRFPEVQITPYLEGKLHSINCSAIHLAKSIMNLMNNAAEAIQGKGQITVSTKNVRFTSPYLGYEPIEPGDYVMISVEDDGPGISPQDISQIFSPFYSKKVMGRSGTGLGLAVVWNTVHDHGGFLDVASSDKGSLFFMYFPTDKFNTPRPVQPIQVLSLHHGNGEKILVVDDQKSQREIASRLLARLGYHPLTAQSGEEAIEYIKHTPVDLVMLDMMMDPGINGCETYERILRHVPGQKAIITSGYSNAENIRRATELGINQFVKKPYSLHELAQALQVEINAEQPSSSP